MRVRVCVCELRKLYTVVFVSALFIRLLFFIVITMVRSVCVRVRRTPGAASSCEVLLSHVVCQRDISHYRCCVQFNVYVFKRAVHSE